MSELGSILGGIGLVILMHIAAAVLSSLLAVLLITIGGIFAQGSLIISFFLAGIGLGQLLYVIPAIIRLYRQRRWGMVKGVIIGAVLTAFLNGGCWLLVVSSVK
ncbi:MAG: hypothetical protein ACM37W_03610 [Actinomycetota bacterium]